MPAYVAGLKDHSAANSIQGDALKVGDLKFVDVNGDGIINDDDATYLGDPLSMAVTPDGDKVFVGFKDGKVCRIDNINSVVDASTGCLDSVQCIVTTTFFEAFANNGQCVTSIAVDPQNINNVVVTLGNYGNDNYVYYSNNALSDNPTFVSKQGNLPKMPIYS